MEKRELTKADLDRGFRSGRMRTSLRFRTHRFIRPAQILLLRSSSPNTGILTTLRRMIITGNPSPRMSARGRMTRSTTPTLTIPRYLTRPSCVISYITPTRATSVCPMTVYWTRSYPDKEW